MAELDLKSRVQCRYIEPERKKTAPKAKIEKKGKKTQKPKQTASKKHKASEKSSSSRSLLSVVDRKVVTLMTRFESSYALLPFGWALASLIIMHSQFPYSCGENCIYTMCGCFADGRYWMNSRSLSTFCHDMMWFSKSQISRCVEWMVYISALWIFTYFPSILCRSHFQQQLTWFEAATY